MIDSKERFVLSVTKFEAGHAFNVYPDDLVIYATLRTFDDTVKN